MENALGQVDGLKQKKKEKKNSDREKLDAKLKCNKTIVGKCVIV